MGKSNRVEETNDSSTISKLSMFHAGYIDDGGKTELEWFVKRERRTALINRGYFIRVAAIQRLFDAFVSSNSGNRIQLINLGAGFDVLFLRLISKHSNCNFIEVDLKGVIKQKASVIRSKIGLGLNDHGKDEPIERILPNYTLIACDLMDTQSLIRYLVDECQLDPDLPTLFIAECVLNYLPAASADELLKVLSSRFRLSTVVVYEQVVPWEKFGQTMLKHFDAINSPLLSIGTYPDVESQLRRYANLGFQAVDCWPIGHLYYNMLDSKERQRIANLELFDEHEMWHAKCAHYVITVASSEEESRTRLFQRFHLPTYNRIELPTSSTSLSCTLRPIKSLFGGYFRRYAHRSALVYRIIDGIRTPFLLSCGGWGIGDKNRQSRLHQPCLLNLATMDCRNCDFDSAGEEPGRLLERCYHSLTPVADGRTLLLFGGRRSPAEALESPAFLRLSEDLTTVHVEPIHGKNGGPGHRWRHGAASDSISVIICGGLTSGRAEPLSDCWTTSVSTQRAEDIEWTKLPDMPIAVHSHSVCYDSKHQLLLVIGGLSIDDRVSNVLQVYSFASGTWTTLAAPASFHRYGSISFMVSGSVIAVGGASSTRGECHDVAVLKLRVDDGVPKIEDDRVYELPNTSEMMLMNHDAVFDSDSCKVYIFGGGGNCFSFGTCFNEAVLEIDLCGVFGEATL